MTSKEYPDPYVCEVCGQTYVVTSLAFECAKRHTPEFRKEQDQIKQMDLTVHDVDKFASDFADALKALRHGIVTNSNVTLTNAQAVALVQGVRHLKGKDANDE